MKFTKITTALPAIGALALTLGSAQATITLTNAGTTVLEDGADSSSITRTISGFDLNGGNAVVLYFTIENGSNVTAKFGSQDMTVVSAQNGVFNASVAYILNPSVSIADVALSYDSGGNPEGQYSAISLGGVGSATASSNTAASFGYTTTTDGGFAVGAAINNNWQGPVPTVSGNPDTFVFTGQSSANNSAIHAYGDIATAGTYTDTYAGGIEAASSVVFDAILIPEPSSALLGGLGALLLLRRRRA